MSDVIIYHNPRCSKSRQTLELLRSRGIEPQIREYLKQPPSPAELEHLLAALGLPARQLLRTKEDDYKTLQLDNPALSEADLIQAMSQQPKLIERPIVICQEQARIGRPPEAVLEIIAS